MKHIHKFEIFESQRPVISYDFDGCLHRSVTGLDPHSFTDWKSWIPYEEMISQLREDAKTHRIVVVTARGKLDLPGAEDFIKHYNLPVEEIIATNNRPKYADLQRIGAVKHYDDNAKMKDELERMGIEFVQAHPLARPVTEQVAVGTKYEIIFINTSFYISDNTLTSFVNRLRKLDPDLEYDPKMNGSMKSSKILYVRSAVLKHEDIRREMNSFIQKYDHLQMQVVVPKVHESQDPREYFRLKMLRDQAAKKRASDKKADLDKVVISDEDVVDILKQVKSKKYDALGNMDKMKKLQKMGLLKNPNAIQAASSFSFPFYLTAKGEALIK